MLTNESYMIAWLIYLVAGLGALVIMNFWLRGGVATGARHTIILLLAGLAFAPARPGPEQDLWAPALIVMPFEWLTSGYEAAIPALGSILNMLGLCLVASVLVYLIRRATANN